MGGELGAECVFGAVCVAGTDSNWYGLVKGLVYIPSWLENLNYDNQIGFLVWKSVRRGSGRTFCPPSDCLPLSCGLCTHVVTQGRTDWFGSGAV